MAPKCVRDGVTHRFEYGQEIKLPMGSWNARDVMIDTLRSVRTLMEGCVNRSDHKAAHKRADDLIFLVVTTLLERTYDDERAEVKAILDAYEKVETLQ